MTEGQRRFWVGVRDFARSVRRSAKVELAVASDALALEQEIEERLAADVEAAPMAAVAEPASTEGPR